MLKYVGLGLAAVVALSMVNIYGNSHRNESGKSFDIVDYHRTNQEMAAYHTLAAFKTCYEEKNGWTVLRICLEAFDGSIAKQLPLRCRTEHRING